MIEEGHAIVRRCITLDRPGPYQLQAAIQAVHCAATSFEATDWDQIVKLYDHLLSLLPTPVVALNRAIAIGEVEGPDAALGAIDPIAPHLDDYHLMHAARGALLRRIGRPPEAATAFDRAAEIAPTERDRRFLIQQAAELEGPYSPG